MADDCFDGTFFHVARPSFELRIAKPVHGEPRLPFLHAASGSDVLVKRLGLAQRSQRQLAVLEHLRVPEGDRVPGRRLDPDTQPSTYVLPEVNNKATRRGSLDTFRGEHLDRPNGWPLRRDQQRRVVTRHLDQGPPRGIKARRGPTGPLTSGVVVLARVQASGDDRSRAAHPGRVSRDYVG